MKKIIIANWKMNPGTLSKARLFMRNILRHLSRIRKVEIILAPPFPFLSEMKRAVKRSTLCAQDVFWKEKGAYTGAVSASMLKSIGVRYVLVGHSERREFAHETDAEINEKIKIAVAHGLQVIVCVGEHARAHEHFERFVRQEITLDLKGLAKRHSKKIIIAYEPIWAIGTGKIVHPPDLYEMGIYIRRTLFDIFGKKAAHSIPIVYGGSVTASNASSFLAVDGINGLLVGGASLNEKEFTRIVESALI